MENWRKLLDPWKEAIENELDRLCDLGEDETIAARVEDMMEITGESKSVIMEYLGLHKEE